MFKGFLLFSTLHLKRRLRNPSSAEEMMMMGNKPEGTVWRKKLSMIKYENYNTRKEIFVSGS